MQNMLLTILISQTAIIVLILQMEIFRDNFNLSNRHLIDERKRKKNMLAIIRQKYNTNNYSVCLVFCSLKNIEILQKVFQDCRRNFRYLEEYENRFHLISFYLILSKKFVSYV